MASTTPATSNAKALKLKPSASSLKNCAGLRWTNADLKLRLKSDPAKLQIAARLRAETTLTIKWIRRSPA